jgi:hypothetical protein
VYTLTKFTKLKTHPTFHAFFELALFEFALLKLHRDFSLHMSLQKLQRVPKTVSTHAFKKVSTTCTDGSAGKTVRTAFVFEVVSDTSSAGVVADIPPLAAKVPRVWPQFGVGTDPTPHTFCSIRPCFAFFAFFSF